jgi:hypothetical protein
MVGWALMNALNAAPGEVFFDLGGGSGGSPGADVAGFGFAVPGAGGPAAFGLTAGSLLCPGGGLAIAVACDLVHAHPMWVYILISVVFAFLFGFACGAESARLREWRNRHVWR